MLISSINLHPLPLEASKLLYVTQGLDLGKILSNDLNKEKQSQDLEVGTSGISFIEQVYCK
jgi:hypothetical protein